MPNFTNISLTLMTLVTVGLTSCAQVPSDQFSASEPLSPTVCDQPVQERSYVATCVSTTSRQPDTPVRDVPYSAQVITRPVIDDQKALTIGDALRNVSGVQGRALTPGLFLAILTWKSNIPFHSTNRYHRPR